MASDYNYLTASNMDNFIPELWHRTVRNDRIQRELFTRFEGKEGSMSGVIAANDLNKEAGDTIHFETLSELYAAVTTGETTLEGQEEKFTNHQYDLTIDFVRHAVAVSRKANKLAFIQAIERAAPMLGRYFAKYFDEVIFDLLIAGATTMGTAAASLSSTDRLTPDILDAIKLGLIRRGALPIEAKVDKNGETQEVYACIIDEVSAYHLQTNSTFRQTIREALPRGTGNPMFSGALGMWNGLVLYQYNGIHQGCHQGTPQRPECALTSATSGTGTKTLTVGTVADRNYTKHFDTTGTLTVSADGSNDAEQCVYTGKTINTFTGVEIANSAHIVGTRITQQNSMSTIVAFGAEALCRAFTERDYAIPGVPKDFNMQVAIALESITGVAAIEDSAGSIPNVLNHRVFADLPDLTSITL